MSSQVPLTVLRSSGPVVEHSYIVKLKAGTNKHAHLEHVNVHIGRLGGHSEVTHPHWNSECFHGYAGKFAGASLDALLSHEDVEYVEEDGIDKPLAVTTQTNAPWGLARISQDAKLVGNETALTFTYKFDSNAPGSGVDIYVLDTGIYTAHTDFEGRASWGLTVAGTPNEDKSGHGTHCAGTAAGKQFGVAKAAKLIAVKYIDDRGSGSKADSITGLNWIKDQYHTTHRPSVVSMSTGGAYSKAQNDTIDSLTAAGITVVVAAGNENTSADDKSPASAPTAITVGAITIADARWYASNYGKCLDIFAPGENVVSCGISGPNSTAIKSGTSMATPHVSGLVAYFAAKDPKIKPAEILQKLHSLSLKDIIKDIPAGTINALARNDVK